MIYTRPGNHPLMDSRTVRHVVTICSVDDIYIIGARTDLKDFQKNFRVSIVVYSEGHA